MTNLANKVPAVLGSFWVIKVLATTVGETGADYLSSDLKFGLSGTSYIMSGILLLALLNQFRRKRYVPVSYWIVVVLMSITGTFITDRLVDELGVSLVTIKGTVDTSIIFLSIITSLIIYLSIKQKKAGHLPN